MGSQSHHPVWSSHPGETVSVSLCPGVTTQRGCAMTHEGVHHDGIVNIDMIAMSIGSSRTYTHLHMRGLGMFM